VAPGETLDRALQQNSLVSRKDRVIDMAQIDLVLAYRILGSRRAQRYTLCSENTLYFGQKAGKTIKVGQAVDLG
jgi:hypothetical protein